MFVIAIFDLADLFPAGDRAMVPAVYAEWCRDHGYGDQTCRECGAALTAYSVNCIDGPDARYVACTNPECIDS